MHITPDYLASHPEVHARELFGVEPWARQVDILRSIAINRETNVPSCHSAGKSWTAALAALLFSTRHVDSVVVTTAPTDRQVREIVWREIHSLLQKARYPIGGRVLTQKIEFGSEWWIIGFTADDSKPDSFQGIHAKSGHVLVVLDEACGIAPDIYEAARSLASGEHGRILAIANPTNPLSEFAKACKQHGALPISAFDVPNCTTFGITQQSVADGSWRKLRGGRPYPTPYLCNPEWIETMYRRWGVESPVYQSRVLGRFPTSSEWAVIPVEWLYRYSDISLSDCCNFGIDIARSGDNESVIARHCGNDLRAVWSGRTPNLEAFIDGPVSDCVTRFDPVEIRIDADGIGGGVADRMKRKWPKKVREIHGSAKPSDTSRFANARAEGWWQLREGIERGDYVIDTTDEELIGQLTSVNYSIPDGRIILEKKETLRRRGIPSPDRADACVYAIARAGPRLVIR